MTEYAPPSLMRNSPAECLVAAICTAILSTAAVWAVSYAILELRFGDQIIPIGKAALPSIQYALSLAGLELPNIVSVVFDQKLSSWTAMHAYLKPYPDVIFAMKAPWMLAAPAALISGLWTFIALRAPPPQTFHISGPKLTRSVRQLRNAIERSAAGIEFHPKVKFTLARETLHTLFFGETGSGKTTILGHFLNAIAKRNDPILIYDQKAQLTEIWLDRSTAFLAPWDERSWSLDIGQDVFNKGQARTLAESMIPDSASDPVWSTAARAIATVIFIDCIKAHGSRWTWQDAAQRLTISHEELARLVEQHEPDSHKLIWPVSKTTQSVLFNATAFLKPISWLADAWRDVPASRRVSLSMWLNGKGPIRIIVQGNEDVRGLSCVLHSMVFRMLLAKIGAPAFTDSRTRRRWIVCDEFLQMGQIKELVGMAQTCRSKGVRLILAAQDFPSVQEVYPGPAANALVNNLNNLIVAGSNCEQTSKLIAGRVGQKTLYRLQTSSSKSAQGIQVSSQYVRTHEPVLTHEFLANDIGQKKVGLKHVTRGVFIGIKNLVAVLDWPRLNFKVVAKSHIPAKWLTTPTGKEAQLPDEIKWLPTHEQQKIVLKRKQPK